MLLEKRIAALAELGNRLKQMDEGLEAVIHKTYLHNSWFTKENTKQAIDAIVEEMLSKDLLEKWISHYTLSDDFISKNVGLILAGNIPLVGFHDVLSVFLSGHRSKIKLSEKDRFLLPYIFEILKDIDPDTAPYFEVMDRLANFDAVIATGSNNTARYFDQYFGKYPNIIRKNRNAIAVLDGKENESELKALGRDVFQFFGLGCRNVSKVYLPKGYEFEPLLEALHTYNELVLHNKYKNNFDYNYTLLIMNKIPHQSNGCVLMTEDTSLQSRIASLHYEYYEDKDQLQKDLENKKEEIQCAVGRVDLDGISVFPFGKAQQPALMDYADGVDTMEFLLSI